MLKKKTGMAVVLAAVVLALVLSVANQVRSSSRGGGRERPEGSRQEEALEDRLWSCTSTTDGIAGTQVHPAETTVEWFFNSRLKLVSASWVAAGEITNTFTSKYTLGPGNTVKMLQSDGSTGLEAAWVVSSSGELTVTRISPSPPTSSVGPHTIQGVDPATGQTLGSVTFPGRSYQEPSEWRFKEIVP